MSHGPLVVMTRASGATGWTVRVDESSVRLGDYVLTGNGAYIERTRGEESFPPLESGEQFMVLDGRTSLEVVCFRAEERSRTQPNPRVMKAIESVRAADTEDARRVLSDVLEENGALAEAEYVRLELKLQSFGDVQSDAFIEGTTQLKALSGVVGPTFRYLVGRDVEGCAGVRWAFRCPAAWEQMQETKKDTERVCTSCRQLVVQVTTEDEARKLARQGVCASVRIDEQTWEGDLAAPEPDDGPQWVGSVAVRPPDPIETRPPVAEQPKKPWWKKLFG